MVGSRLPTSETDAEKPRDSWELGASVETKHLTLFNKAGGATKLTATTVYMNAAHSSLPAAITLVQDWSAAAPEHSESPSECTDLPHSTLDLAESGCSGVQASPTRVMVLDHAIERENVFARFSPRQVAPL
jgi:hypothetical protein